MTARNYIVGIPASVTGGGKTTFVAGFANLGEVDLSRALSASLVTDADIFYAPALSATASLLPGLVTESDNIYAPSIANTLQFLQPSTVADAEAFYTATITPGAIALAPVAFSDADAFFAPSIADTEQFLQPAVVSDADMFSMPTVAAGATLLPALVTDADTIPASTIGYIPLLQPALVPADDTVYPASTAGIVILAPALLVDPDDIPTVDAGWRLFGQLLVDVDFVDSPHVETLTYLLPETINDETESVDNYPFFIQGVTGGIPVPPPSGVLTGSISYPRRMTGTLDRRPRLTGSMTRSTRVLTGSLKRK